MENVTFLARLKCGFNHRTLASSAAAHFNAMLRPTARFGLATFRFLCTEPIEKKTLAHQLYKQ
ncbi:MAG TPA: hypothetical protein DDZ82_08690 [Rhodobacteraceae bacterium]|nr:hypothetical protein [Paracoccaceae bacterium]